MGDDWSEFLEEYGDMVSEYGPGNMTEGNGSMDILS